jgi:hypothetical protein
MGIERAMGFYVFTRTRLRASSRRKDDFFFRQKSPLCCTYVGCTTGTAETMGPKNVASSATTQEMQERIVIIPAPPSNNAGSQSESTPPIVHAIGGTIGSALSVLLFYPLERIRVEMMKSAGAVGATNTAVAHQVPITVESSCTPHQTDEPINVESMFLSAEDAPSGFLTQALVLEAKGDDDRLHNVEDKSISSSSSFVAIENPSSYEILSEASSNNASSISSRQTAVAEDIDLRHSDENRSPAEVSEALSSSNEEGKPFKVEIEELITSNRNIRPISSVQSTNCDPSIDLFPIDDGMSYTNSYSEKNKSSDLTTPTTISTWRCFLHLYEKKDLYTGVIPVICTLTISNFIYFYAYEILKQRLLPSFSTCSANHNQRVDGSTDANSLSKNTTITSSTITTSSDSITTTVLDNGTSTAVRIVTTTLSTITTNNDDKAFSSSSSSVSEVTSRNLLLRSFLASALAGVINVLMTNPIFVANLRIMQNNDAAEVDNDGEPIAHKQLRRSLPSEVLYILKHEGISKLWSGTLTSLLLVSNPAINHFLYEHIRNYIVNTRRYKIKKYLTHSHSLRPWEAFLIGAFAKTVATVVTYPLQLAQVLIRVQKARTKTSASSASSSSADSSECLHDASSPQPNEQVNYRGTWDCISCLYRKGGLAALYVGMDAKLMQTVLTAAFTFLTYEQIISFVRRSYRTTRMLSK